MISMNITDYLDYIIAAVGASIGYFFGGFDGFFHALIAFVVIDYVTGVWAAGIEKRLSSSMGFEGIKRKFTIFLVIGVTHIIEKELFGGTKEFLRDGVICFYLSNEGISILENASIIGIPIPHFIKEKLSQIKDKYNSKDDE